jgi:hypothetical protein
MALDDSLAALSSALILLSSRFRRSSRSESRSRLEDFSLRMIWASLSADGVEELLPDEPPLRVAGRCSRDLLVLGSSLVGEAGASDKAYLRVPSRPSTKLPESSSSQSSIKATLSRVDMVTLWTKFRPVVG